MVKKNPNNFQKTLAWLFFAAAQTERLFEHVVAEWNTFSVVKILVTEVATTGHHEEPVAHPGFWRRNLYSSAVAQKLLLWSVKENPNTSTLANKFLFLTSGLYTLVDFWGLPNRTRLKSIVSANFPLHN